MRWSWALVFLAFAGCDRTTGRDDPAGTSDPPASPPVVSSVASVRASLRTVKTTVRRFSGGGTLWDIEGRVQLAPTTFEVEVEGFAGALEEAARRGVCGALEGPVHRCAEGAEATLRLAITQGDGVLEVSLRGRPRARRYGVRPRPEVVQAAPWHEVAVEARVGAVEDEAGAEALGRELQERWREAVDEALRADARPMGAAVIKTVVREEALAARVQQGREHHGRPVWVAGGKVWGLFTAGTTHLVHVLDPRGGAAGAIFDGRSEPVRHGGAFASVGADRLLYAVDAWLPWPAMGERPARPQESCTKSTCRGITVVGVDGAGALARVRRVDGYARVSNAVAGPEGAIYVVGGKGTRAWLLRLDGTTEAGVRASVEVPRQSEEPWAYRVHVRPRDVVVESAGGLWSVDPQLRGGAAPVHRFRPVRGEGAVGLDVAFVGERGVIVHSRQGDGHRLRRLPVAGAGWEVALDGVPAALRLGVAGDVVFVEDDGLRSAADGARLGAPVPEGTEVAFAEVGAALVGCTKDGVARWSAAGEVEAEVRLPWRCRAVGAGPAGGVLVATSYPIGAYLLRSPTGW